MKCEKCNGSGYQSAAKEMGMQDYPFMMRPLGVWQCDYCGGTGEQFNPSEMIEKLKEEKPEEYEKIMQEFREALSKIKPNWIDKI